MPYISVDHHDHQSIHPTVDNRGTHQTAVKISRELYRLSLFNIVVKKEFHSVKSPAPALIEG